MADGAYDGDPIYRAVADRAPAATVIIPPRATAVASAAADGAPTPGDRHIEMIAAKGRLGSQKAVGYGRRSLVETGMLRYKTIIGRTLRARALPAQDSARTKGRGQGRLQGAQPHDRSRHAGLPKDRLNPSKCQNSPYSRCGQQRRAMLPVLWRDPNKIALLTNLTTPSGGLCNHDALRRQWNPRVAASDEIGDQMP